MEKEIVISMINVVSEKKRPRIKKRIYKQEKHFNLDDKRWMIQEPTRGEHQSEERKRSPLIEDDLIDDDMVTCELCKKRRKSCW